MNTHQQGDFQICISVPLSPISVKLLTFRIDLLGIDFTYNYVYNILTLFDGGTNFLSPQG